MTSTFVLAASAIVTDLASAELAPPTGDTRPLWLAAVDWTLAAASIVLLCFTILRLTRGDGALLLHNAPARANRVREDAVLLVIVTYMLAAGVAAQLTGPPKDELHSASTALVVGFSAHLAGVIACLFVARFRFVGGVRAFLLGVAESSMRFRARQLLALFILAVGFPPFIHHATVLFIHLFDPAFVPSSHPTIEAIHDPGAGVGLVSMLWLSAVIAAPLGEEFFFRGVLQSFLVTISGSRWRGIALAALAFGAVHFEQFHAVPALVFLGLILGYSYERTGSLVVPVSMHALFNLKTLVWDRLCAVGW